ncbi:MAG: hypothetical protein KKG95_03560, partial [Candidatus Omnitrophica bacterium]|nr:hypothetical protein [Candidatus Omnitrophota bacterium]
PHYLTSRSYEHYTSFSILTTGSKIGEYRTHRAFKCGIVSFAVLFCFAALLFSVIEPGKDGQVSDSKFRIPESCTVQPELKTNTVDKFRRAWETKQNEAMLE